jgi:hypothetical protein
LAAVYAYDGRGPAQSSGRTAFKETVMKAIVVAVVIALVPVNVAPALSSIHAGSSKASIGAPAAWPTICFQFGFWKYCI